VIDYPSIYPIDPHWTSYTILDGYINFIFQSWLLFSAKSPCLLGHFQYHPQISWSFSPKKNHRFLWFLPKKNTDPAFHRVPSPPLEDASHSGVRPNQPHCWRSAWAAKRSSAMRSWPLEMAERSGGVSFPQKTSEVLQKWVVKIHIYK